MIKQQLDSFFLLSCHYSVGWVLTGLDKKKPICQVRDPIKSLPSLWRDESSTAVLQLYHTVNVGFWPRRCNIDFGLKRNEPRSASSETNKAQPPPRGSRKHNWQSCAQVFFEVLTGWHRVPIWPLALLPPRPPLFTAAQQASLSADWRVLAAGARPLLPVPSQGSLQAGRWAKSKRWS